MSSATEQPVVDVEALRAKYADYALARDLTAQQGFSPSLQEQGTPAALAAASANDLAPLERLLTALARPYEEGGQPDELLNPPPAGTPVCRTFCGT